MMDMWTNNYYTKDMNDKKAASRFSTRSSFYPDLVTILLVFPYVGSGSQ